MSIAPRDLGIAQAEVRPERTPAGLEDLAELRRRRMLVLALNLVTCAAFAWLAAEVLGAGGWSLVDVGIFACFLVGLPWSVLGFWNAAIGFWLLHGVRDGLARVAPFAAAADREDPLRVRCAVLMFLRNEDPRRAFARLRTIKASIDATGQGHAFDYFVLSDTSDPAIAGREEEEFARWVAEAGEPGRIVYRRRERNIGFKAGNLRDFCRRWGTAYELMLPLDADSLMSGRTVLRLARIMQAYPRIGILQSLVVGMPSASLFARVFQFGMRAGMRTYTMGQAWWVGDCGPFWGHNAMVRIAPFVRHCELPLLSGEPPLGGHVMSHDQVEAALMRRAGFEVRVLPVEEGSWEENPPTLLEFSRRDVRWCQGNLQYLRLLDLPGLLPTSRFQLVWAILMFVGVPAWTALIALAALKPFDSDPAGSFPTALGIALYLAFLLVYLAPKLAGYLDVLITPNAAKRYGGRGRFLVGALSELVFSFLLGAATTFRITLFMIGLLFGRSAIWSGQARDVHALSWTTALSGLWPQLLFGLVVCGVLAWQAPAVLAWGSPLLAGFLVAVPFAVLTADPAIGSRAERKGLCAIPEDLDPPWEITSVRTAGRER
ncbi:MAG: glucans biosynthesis glucosyltransferase MdoH [Geminicoccaceae bacterium]|nr:glucans biosynthesis glucosyltransferase MdoH [Geminicoccaceae bacterium]MCS7267859.1 glucans biosynthesis glucosyltransferase MdoH [Geminicoccaceae bacterium]MCX7630004.1 glucans biosynthesis glucosyltransferase MdoH [Geminicoccaceae bacterium]MDW8124518.1 glucans biosynthesis glucosyltransferase MdoH [Geminicoccaceae bacterium]MDW8341354.1 glucans biosynthesis glucosyltransferase MdoH [Geminicoccaceae bacterium]